MNALNKTENKNIVWLAIISLVASGLFSFMGAPFLRVLFISVRSLFFWTIATLFIGSLLVLGAKNYQLSETAVYVGALWMTLGAYGELEKRGISWKTAGFLSLLAGLMFSAAGYFLILKNFENASSLKELVEPISEAIGQSLPTMKSDFSADELLSKLPGILMASLFISLATGIVFESKVSRLFKLKRERIASGVRWIEFRLPDSFIWAALISCSLVLLNSSLQFPEWLRSIYFSFLILALVLEFFQGLSVVEFMLRFYRAGAFTRTLMYLFVFLQLAPLIVVLGVVDYWADFRKLVRKKKKLTN